MCLFFSIKKILHGVKEVKLCYKLNWLWSLYQGKWTCGRLLAYYYDRLFWLCSIEYLPWFLSHKGWDFCHKSSHTEILICHSCIALPQFTTYILFCFVHGLCICYPHQSYYWNLLSQSTLLYLSLLPALIYYIKPCNMVKVWTGSCFHLLAPN